MPSYSTIAIANEFIERHDPSAHPSQMQLHKLVFIANGWNLAVNEEPLVTEQAQAWDNGPVFRGLWNHIRDYGYGPKSHMLENPFTEKPARAKLLPEESEIVDRVWRRYGRFSGSILSRMTHEPGTPWTITYFSKGRDALIPNELVKEHYIDLAMAGRASPT